jgi:hypothetical protein
MMKELVLETDEQINSMKGERFFTLVDWKKVRELSGVQDLIKEATGGKGEGMDIDKLKLKKSSYTGFDNQEVYIEIRFRMLRILKGLFWEKYEEGECGGATAKLLAETCDQALDQTHLPVDIWTNIYLYFTSISSIRAWFKFTSWPLLGRLAMSYIAEHMTFIYDTVSMLIMGIDEVLENQRRVPLQQTYTKVIINELQANRDNAENYLLTLSENFGDLIKAIQSRRAASIVLAHQKAKLERQLAEGEIEAKEYNRIRGDIDDRLNEINNYQPKATELSFSSLAVDFPLFKALKHEEFESIKGQIKEKKFANDEMLLEKAKPCEGLFVILKGTVEEKVEKSSTRRGLGSVVSYINVVNSNAKICQSSVQAKSEVVANLIPFDAVATIIKKNTKFKEVCQRNAFEALVKLSAKSPLQDLDDRTLTHLSFTGTFKYLKKGTGKDSKVKVKHGAWLFSGEVAAAVEAGGAEVKLKENSFVPPSDKEYKATRDSTVLVFTRSLEEGEKGHHGHHAAHGHALAVPAGVSDRKHSIQAQMEHEKEIEKAFQRSGGGSEDGGDEVKVEVKDDDHEENPEPEAEEEKGQDFNKEVRAAKAQDRDEEGDADEEEEARLKLEEEEREKAAAAKAAEEKEQQEKASKSPKGGKKKKKN